MAEPDPVTVLCPECGTVFEVHDVRALLLALHQAHECEQVAELFAHRSEP